MLIEQLAEMLAPGEKVVLTIEVSPTIGNVDVLIQPVFKSALADGPDAVKQARAALAMPLKVRGRAVEMDSQLMQTLAEYGERRSSIREALPALHALKEQGKMVQAAIENGDEKAVASKEGAVGVAADASDDDKPAGDPVTAHAESRETQGNPDSLI